MVVLDQRCSQLRSNKMKSFAFFKKLFIRLIRVIHLLVGIFNARESSRTRDVLRYYETLQEQFATLPFFLWKVSCVEK